MPDAIIIAIVGAGASIMSGMLSYFAGLRKHGADTSVAQLEAKGALEDRLLERINKLEERLDAEHSQCREDIRNALSASERDCEERMIRRERRLRRDIAKQLSRLDERSDVEIDID